MASFGNAVNQNLITLNVGNAKAAIFFTGLVDCELQHHKMSVLLPATFSLISLSQGPFDIIYVA